ncbi:ABC transporter permease [Polymorphobacter glacialis]|uniref:ABC transporter permease n=1 Tax=Sandarakinorhabdus glacialis TaxID=1614636 RepID=A0A917E5Z6_9SPHN|nr:DUF4198 domain-containing protein [Polymorphobacter glacialis]GGE02805.1 ABC transporter permease [Polymorphobacter glacialis]
MTSRISHRLALLAAGALMVATPALAHRQWMLPSATILSGDDAWVTVDAAVSNDLFYFDHQPMGTTGIRATAPDGSETKIENAATGRYRSTFDVHLLQKGTYRIENSSNGVMGSYKLGGEEKRLPRGTTSENLKDAIPAGATDVRTSEASNRNEIYVTVGAPTTTVFKPSGKGIELVPVTHPNDLVAGEAATFQFLLDGKPAANLGVTVIPGGNRYRGVLGQMDLKTDAQGKVSVTWPSAGMYWVNASVGGGREGGPPGGPGGPGAGAGAAPPAARPMPTGPQPRRANYVTTLEVLAP